MIEFNKGPTKLERVAREKAEKQHAIQELKQAGWQTTTGLPFAIVKALKDDPSMMHVNQSTLANHIYGFIQEILAAESEGYEAQNTMMVSVHKFLSRDFVLKIEQKARERYKRKK